MKNILAFLAVFLFSHAVWSTEQTPDVLFYKGQKLSLYTGWGHPSPLQTYFQQKEIKYPFVMLSTANYRGHIATWEIENDVLLLTEIKIREDKFKPEKYNIKSESDSIISDGNIFADWFSGVLQCSLKNETLYFYVRDGKVVDKQTITEKDLKRITNISEKDTTDHELMRKYSMLYLNQNYISYYFRLSSEDKISNGDKSGRFITKQGFSPMLKLFNNDHTRWPYNWENFEKSGAPYCSWIVENNKIYLSKIGLQTGTSFFEVQQYNVPLEELFNSEIENNKVFADWLSDIYIIQHGEEKEDPLLPGFKEFKMESITYMRVLNGVIIEEYTIPADYTKNGIPDDINPDLKVILDQLQRI